MKGKIILIQLFLLPVIFLSVRGEDNIWMKFIDEPNEANYKICQQQIADSLSGKYEKHKSPAFLQLMDEGSVGKVLTLVENANAYATDLCFQFYPLFIGYPNYLERFDISLGKVINKNPQLFLMLLRKYLLAAAGNIYDIEGLLTNYGDEFVDKLDRQFHETKERIKSLQKVKEKDYERIRNRCVKILRKRIDAINEIQSKRKENN